MKKSLTLILTFLLSFLLILPADSMAAQEVPVSVYVDGIKLSFDVDPVIENGRTLVPMRRIFETLGAEVEWIDASKTAVARKDDIVIQISAGSSFLVKNDVPIGLDVGAKISDSRMLVPVRAVSEGLEAFVDWHANARRVIIESKGAVSFKTLSADDSALFESLLPSLRLRIEQHDIFDSVQGSASEYAEGISMGDRAAVEFISKVWNASVIAELYKIQNESQTLYIVYEYEDINEEYVTRVYENIAKEKKALAGDVFTVRFAEFGDFKGVLVSFNEADFKDNSRYMAIVSDGSGVRFFSARTSADASKLCNVYEKTSSGYRPCGTSVRDEAAFVTAVADLMNK